MKPTVDLRPELLGVRNQQRRGSCLAFAATAAHENHARLAEPLSVEFLFLHAITGASGGNPADGASMAEIGRALNAPGQPLEVVWPYEAIQLPLGLWSPPTALGKLWSTSSSQVPSDFDEIIALLDAGKPVILGILITANFGRCDATGLLPTSLPDPIRGRHAVLAVGHGVDASSGYLLIRNSWGLGWGLQGHAWLSRDYIDQHLCEAMILR